MEEGDFITFEQALEFLPDKEEIHTNVQMLIMGGTVLIGADWARDAILEALRDAPEIRVCGPGAQEAGHGMAIPYPAHESRWLFIETNRNLLTYEGEQL